ncbi:hypothetical protein DYH09_28080 [bacterium CPR1]|nr:hypothetical protein [bacterium CPR1]
MRASFAGVTLELPAFFQAGSEALAVLEPQLTLNVKTLPDAASADEIADAYARFLGQSIPGLEELSRESTELGVLREQTFRQDASQVYQRQLYLVPVPPRAYVVTCTVVDAELDSARERAGRVLARVARPGMDSLGLGAVEVDLPDCNQVMFLPASLPEMLRPMLLMAWDTFGGSPQEHAASTLAEAGTEIVTLEQGMVGSLYRREMLLQQDGNDLFAAHLHLRRGQRSVLLALTGEVRIASLLAAAARELASQLSYFRIDRHRDLP